MKPYSYFQKIIFFFFFYSFFIFNSAYAEETPAAKPQAAGQVVWVKGSMKAIGAQGERVLQRRDVVFTKDTIITDDTSTGQIVFSDNTLLAVSPKSSIRIDQYHFSGGKAPQTEEYVLNIAKGGFRTITGAIAKSNPNKYLVKTPTATIGVRGTNYILTISRLNEVYTQITSGSIQVITPQGSAILTQGTDKLYMVVKPDQPPVILKSAPAVFNEVPNVVPAQSTLPATTDSTTTAAPPAPTGTSGDGGSGGSTGGDAGASGTTSSETSTSSETKSDEVVASPTSEQSGGASSTGGSQDKSSGFCIK